MNDLLDLTIKAHGGIERWRRISTITARLTATGAVWGIKGHGDLFADVTVEAEAHRQHLTSTKLGRRSVFEPHRTAVGAEERLNPRARFEGATLETPWDELDAVFFGGQALWTYLTLPFVVAEREFVTEELSPWTEEGEQWRRLRVVFPDDVETHCREQVLHIDGDGMIRRHDYTAEIVGGGPAAHYPSRYATVDGIVFPTKRRVFSRTAEGHSVPEPVLIEIDLTDFSLT